MAQQDQADDRIEVSRTDDALNFLVDTDNAAEDMNRLLSGVSTEEIDTIKVELTTDGTPGHPLSVLTDGEELTLSDSPSDSPTDDGGPATTTGDGGSQAGTEAPPQTAVANGSEATQQPRIETSPGRSTAQTPSANGGDAESQQERGSIDWSRISEEDRKLGVIKEETAAHEVLAAINEHAPVTTSELYNLVDRPQGTVTGRVSDLYKKKLTERREVDDPDGNHEYRPTDHGKLVLQDMANP